MQLKVSRRLNYSVYLEIPTSTRVIEKEYRSYKNTKFGDKTLLIGSCDYGDENDILISDKQLIVGEENDFYVPDVSLNETGYKYILDDYDNPVFIHHLVEFTWLTTHIKNKLRYEKDADGQPMYQIDHLDGNKTNNSPNNLEVVPREVNSLRALIKFSTNRPDVEPLYYSYLKNNIIAAISTGGERKVKSLESLLDELSKQSDPKFDKVKCLDFIVQLFKEG